MIWYVEEGIGEHRAISLDGAEIAGARLDWPGSLAAGQVEEARLISRTAGSTSGTARFACGEEALVDQLPTDAMEGALIRLIVTRASMMERRRTKLAQAKPTDKAVCDAPTLADGLQAEGHDVRIVRSFPESDWHELWSEAWSGDVPFTNGALQIFDTPAMTLIDIDGIGSPSSLANAATESIAKSLARFDLGGSIGIDFPTLHSKTERKLVNAMLATELRNWPHERTAINGFGFVQIVAKLSRVPITRRLASARAGACARLLLRQAEHIEEPGAILLTVHPALRAKLKPEWLEELAKRTGREIRIEAAPTLALESGFAQAVPL